MHEDSSYLTVDQVAERLHTTPPALYSQRHRDESPGNLGVKVGRRILWRRSDLDAWFDSQKATASAAT